jgi:epoxyqueuosine reductase
MGNRVYGCDDCQRVCPWNKHAQTASLPDFDVRQGLDAADLVSLFAWDEATFTARHAGSAIARIGHVRWLRNLAVGLGNALRAAASAGRLADCETIRAALQARSVHASDLVREHVAWALAQAPDR